MMRIILISSLVIILLGEACRTSTTKHKDSIVLLAEPIVEKDAFGNSERKSLIDSLRWLMYALNYDFYVVNENDKYKKQPVLDFNLELWRIERGALDTVSYYFIPKREPGERYIIVPDDNMGIETVDGIPILCLSGSAKYIGTIDAMKSELYFKDVDSIFLNFLDNSNSELNVWLKKEYGARKGKSN